MDFARHYFIRHILQNARLPLRLRKHVLGAMLPLPHSAKKFRLRLFDGIYEGTLDNFIDRQVYLYGCYEAATLRLMRQVLALQRAQRLMPCYVDVGANCGLHLVGTMGRFQSAYGFEPWDVIRRRCERHIAINRKADSVKCFPFGLSECDGSLSYYRPVGRNWGCGSFLPQKGTETESTTTLPVRKGDDVIAELGIAPTLIKIDVEGSDRAVLRGLGHTIRRFEPVIVFELNRNSVKDLASHDDLAGLIGKPFQAFGLKRGRETPILKPLTSTRKWENAVVFVGAKGARVLETMRRNNHV